MDTLQIVEILTSHKLWLSTRGRQGFRANLSLQNLQGALLENCNLTGAIIIGSNLKAANLKNTILKYSFISHSDLRGANLSGTDFSYATMIKVNVFEGELSNSTLTGAHLCHLGNDNAVPKFTKKNIPSVIILSSYNFSKK